MLSLNIEKLGDMTVVECKGGIVRSDAAMKVLQAITSQQNARIVVLDLTEVQSIEGGLGTLWFLQRWTQDHDIELKLFNPTGSVKNKLEHNKAMLRFDIASFNEMMSLLADAGHHHSKAA